MAIITSSLLLRSICAFHVTIAYYLIRAPSTLIDQNMVVILGQAMRIPAASFTSTSSAIAHPASSSFASASPATALGGLFLSLLALADFTAVGLPDPLYLAYWTAQAPVRLTFFMILSMWIYVTRPTPGVMGGIQPDGFGKEVKNSLVFSWAFFETCLMFWLFLIVREERGEAAKREAGRKAAERQL